MAKKTYLDLRSWTWKPDYRHTDKYHGLVLVRFNLLQTWDIQTDTQTKCIISLRRLIITLPIPFAHTSIFVIPFVLYYNLKMQNNLNYLDLRRIKFTVISFEWKLPHHNMHHHENCEFWNCRSKFKFCKLMNACSDVMKRHQMDDRIKSQDTLLISGRLQDAKSSWWMGKNYEWKIT